MYTYKEMQKILCNLTDEQKVMQVMAYDQVEEIYFYISGMKVDDDNAPLDDNHPFMIATNKVNQSYLYQDMINDIYALDFEQRDFDISICDESLDEWFSMQGLGIMFGDDIAPNMKNDQPYLVYPQE